MLDAEAEQSTAALQEQMFGLHIVLLSLDVYACGLYQDDLAKSSQGLYVRTTIQNLFLVWSDFLKQVNRIMSRNLHVCLPKRTILAWYINANNFFISKKIPVPSLPTVMSCFIMLLIFLIQIVYDYCKSSYFIQRLVESSRCFNTDLLALFIIHEY